MTVALVAQGLCISNSAVRSGMTGKRPQSFQEGNSALHAKCQPDFTSSNPHEVRRARRTSDHFESGRVQSGDPMRSRRARDKWSELRAHTTGIPSSGERATAVARPRMVRVTGTTMTSLRWSMTSLRVRIRTGRRLSGSRNVYQRISPRFKRSPPNRRSPTREVRHRLRILRFEEAGRGRHRYRSPEDDWRAAGAAGVALRAKGDRPEV